MTRKPDPKQAVYLKPNQRRRRRVREAKPAAAWEPHRGDQALDAWGVALRTLRWRGVDVSNSWKPVEGLAQPASQSSPIRRT